MATLGFFGKNQHNEDGIDDVVLGIQERNLGQEKGHGLVQLNRQRRGSIRVGDDDSKASVRQIVLESRRKTKAGALTGGARSVVREVRKEVGWRAAQARPRKKKRRGKKKKLGRRGKMQKAEGKRLSPKKKSVKERFPNLGN